MSGTDRYITLMSSLPHLGALFDTQLQPLSWTSLSKRLTMLDEEDAQRLKAINQFLAWREYPKRETDRNVFTRYRQLEPFLTSPTLKKVIQQRLEIRTVVAALRRQTNGQSTPPPSDENWGFGRWVSTIQRHWNASDLGLKRVFPWITTARQHIENQQTREMEQLILTVVWNHLDKLGQWHQFDFEAVVIYFQRWQVVRWWLYYQNAQADIRFTKLVNQGLGQYDNLFREGVNHVK
ncbi:hypothetical protein ACQZV8_00210 [Magnetococcales bacterium HHB-1]